MFYLATSFSFFTSTPFSSDYSSPLLCDHFYCVSISSFFYSSSLCRISAARKLLFSTFSCLAFRFALDYSNSVIRMVRMPIFCPTYAMKSFKFDSHTHLYAWLLAVGLFLLQNY